MAGILKWLGYSSTSREERIPDEVRRAFGQLRNVEWLGKGELLRRVGRELGKAKSPDDLFADVQKILKASSVEQVRFMSRLYGDTREERIMFVYGCAEAADDRLTGSEYSRERTVALAGAVVDGWREYGDGGANWLLNTMPLLFTACVEGALRRRVLGESGAAGAAWTLAPAVDAAEAAVESGQARMSRLTVTRATAWALSMGVESPIEPWRLLYSSIRDGCSFSRFVPRVRGYSGPTLLVVREAGEGGHVFGAYVAGGWKDQTSYFGTPRCFLFSLHPVFAVFRPTGVEHAYVYMNSRSKHAYPLGLGFGGSCHAPRLWLDASFDHGRATPIDPTYSRGYLTPSIDFRIDAVEVWGCGGSVAEAALEREQKAEESFQESRRKVDRSRFAEDNGADKWMLDMIGRKSHGDAYRAEVDEEISNSKKLAMPTFEKPP